METPYNYFEDPKAEGEKEIADAMIDAGVKKDRQGVIDGLLKEATEKGDEELFEIAGKIEQEEFAKKKENENKNIKLTPEQEEELLNDKIDAYIEGYFKNYYPNKGGDEKIKLSDELSKRLRVIYDKIVIENKKMLETDDDYDNNLEMAFEALKEERGNNTKKYEGIYSVQGGVVDVEPEKNKEAI